MQQRTYTCECTYATTHPSNIRRHRTACKARGIILQLTAALEASRAECAQAKEALSRVGGARRVATTGVDARGGGGRALVAFGADDFTSVTPHMFAALAAHPQMAVRSLYAALRRTPENRNVHIPNKRENVVRVYAGHDEWVLRQRDVVLRELVHALADRIAIALETVAVRTLISHDAIARWALYHDAICTTKSAMAECVTQVELVILGERI